ncbi:GIY-YIG nuclease family protein [Aliarcobacter butzleri]|uniref:GIY-YIG nuclease family protein n=1 Tax=Aliarcobacter butzleri TaxID=28197 RepID=UPI00263EEC9B|nr:GIY-YIG nuclease family protein [Aliarcobacter butzleri]MDN5111033.1 GIY-YIG nuclease family protein [Aliarcobacter butzleri]
MPGNNIEKQLNDIAIVKDHSVEMFFAPSKWIHNDYSVRQWVIENFPPEPRSVIPRKSGVYAFVITPNIFDFNGANGLFYVGKATILYERISSYISEIGKDFMRTNRPHIWKMINRWNGHLKYYYTITANEEEAKELEDKMIEAFVPYFNREYDAETSRTRRAF